MNEDELYSFRQMKGGSLMVWMADGYGGKTSLVFFNGRQKHTDCIEALNSDLLRYESELGEKE